MSSNLIKYTPMEHQWKMCEYLRIHNGGLLYCEMRTGKTLGALCYLIEIRKLPILIVAPSMAMMNWKNWMVAQGFKESMISVVDGTRKKREKELNRNCPIVITNYEMSLKYKLKNIKPWKVLLFDEIVRISNINASITKYWIQGSRNPDQIRIGLTGEPAPERCLQFATQFMVVFGSFMGYTSYMHYYMENWRLNPYSGKDEPISATHEDYVRLYVQKHAHCVTMKSLGLGSKILYNVAYFDLNSQQQKLMETVRKLRKEGNALKGVPFNQNPYKMKASTMERKIAAGLHPEDHRLINADKMKFIIETYRETPEPSIILSHYKAPLFAMEYALKKKGIKCGLIHGATGLVSEKESIVDAFKNEEYDLFLGQTRSIKFNYDLSRSDITYYPNNSFSRDDRAQSQMRTTNLNKNTPVGMMDLIYRDTMDESLVKTLRSKEKISYSYIDLNFEAECFKKRY